MAKDKGQGSPAAPQPDQPTAYGRWLIWSREHRQFWRSVQPNGITQGYTPDVDYAHRFTHAEAARIVEDAQRAGMPAEPEARRRWPPEAMVLAPECAPCAAILDTLPAQWQVAIAAFLASTTRDEDHNSYGALDAPKLIRMLLEDVSLMIQRPGSWEGANMATVMRSHGYWAHENDRLCDAARHAYWGGKDKDPYERRQREDFSSKA